MSERRAVAWAGRIGLIAVSTIGIAIVAEVGLRLIDAKAPPSSSERALGLDELATPHVEGLFADHPYRTNALGFRGPDYDARPSADAFRILFTGDSVTMGWRVDEAEAYPLVIEELLGSASTGPGAAGLRIESINVGLAGVNIAGAMDRLEAGDRAYASDLFVYGYTLNDIESLTYKSTSMKANFALVRRYWRYADSSSHLVRAVWPRLVSLRERMAPTVPPWDETLRANYLENPDAWVYVERGLDRFAELARSRGVCAHLLIHTELYDLDADAHAFTDLYARVASAAKARGISVSESFPRFAGRDAEALHAAYLDQHPGAEAHRLLAESLAEGLLSLPQSCFARSGAGRRPLDPARVAAPPAGT